MVDGRRLRPVFGEALSRSKLEVIALLVRWYL
jgi:hypothetical protein